MLLQKSMHFFFLWKNALHIPEKDFRAYLGTLRCTDEWDETCKIRCAVEQSINHFER